MYKGLEAGTKLERLPAAFHPDELG